MDIVTTTGRRMTAALQDALDNMPRAHRRAAIAAFAGGDGDLGAIYRALSLELRLVDLREEETFTRLGVEMAQPPEWLPEPPAISGP